MNIKTILNSVFFLFHLPKHRGLFNQAMVITGATGCYTDATGIVVGAFTNDVFEHDVEFDDPNADLTCTPNIFDETWTEAASDETIDYDRSGDLSTGDLTIFDFNAVVPGATGPSPGPLGSVSGRCFQIENARDPDETSYCTIVFIFDEGGLVVEGFSNDMTIVGGSGCFAGLTGKVQGTQRTNMLFDYVWTLD